MPLEREIAIKYIGEKLGHIQSIKQIEVAKRLCVDAAKNELKQRVKM